MRSRWGIQSPDRPPPQTHAGDFAGHGLVDVATDYGIILLASPSVDGEHASEATGGARVGPEAPWSSHGGRFRRMAGSWNSTATRPVRRALQARSMPQVRRAAGCAFRLGPSMRMRKRTIRDEATVDLCAVRPGFLMPASVVHRHLVDRRAGDRETVPLRGPSNSFSADAEIKFTECPTSRRRRRQPKMRRAPRRDAGANQVASRDSSRCAGPAPRGVWHGTQERVRHRGGRSSLERAADGDLNPHLAETWRLGGQRQVGGRSVGCIRHRNVVGLVAGHHLVARHAIQQACIMGHCGVVMRQRRSVSARGSSMEPAAPRSAFRPPSRRSGSRRSHRAYSRP